MERLKAFLFIVCTPSIAKHLIRLFKSAPVLIFLYIIFDFAWRLMPDSFKGFIGIQMFYYHFCFFAFMSVLEAK